MAAAHGLTELECCTLGVIAQHGPCSTYQVRRIFAASPTGEWSASAGSIYPVVERLLRLKLVKVERRKADARGRRDLTITEGGLKAMRNWIMNLDPWAAKATPDPIRTRMHFLDYLNSKKDWSAFFLRAEELTRLAIGEQEVYRQAQRGESIADDLAILGGIVQLEARLKWLQKARDLLDRARPLDDPIVRPP